MAFTENCSIFGSVDERGINLVVRHLMRQRPSLFNYGTELFLARPDLLCEKIDATSDVIKRGNPLFTIEDPIPVVGTDNKIGLHFCFQVTKAEIDFHPGNVIQLPPELGPPLAKQRFAFRVRVCGGLGCPSSKRFDGFQLPPLPPGKDRRRDKKRPELPPVPLPVDGLDCFCLELFAVGHVEVEGPKGSQQYVVGKLDGLEIVDIEPKGLENSIECYLKLLIHHVILPRVKVALEKISFDILDGLATINLFATPISGSVPFNPGVEDDKLEVFINMEVS